jgi:FAD/FMN-containing dehydrogenase
MIKFLVRSIKYVLVTLTVLLSAIIILFFSVTAPPEAAEVSGNTVQDVTQLNTIEVDKIEKPVSTAAIAELIKNHDGPISIGGARHSMGGQIATERALHLDMRDFDEIIDFSKEKKEITVQSGITWRKIQSFIDPHDLSVQIMQTYANFTVGGSLSVNVHGRYIGQGPIIHSVKSIKIILADGTEVTASPTENVEIFYGCIGGYGGLGVITEVTLSLTDNVKILRSNETMEAAAYKNYFLEKIRNDSTIVFHNADLYPDDYTIVNAVSFTKTDRDVTVHERLKPVDENYRPERFAMWLVSEVPFGKWMRQHWADPLYFGRDAVRWRNYEASYDANELEPTSRKNATYVLQEYFVPVEQFDVFVPAMAKIFQAHDTNIINVSVRHAHKDPGSYLAWAKDEVFCFVVYYKQGTTLTDREKVGDWTRKLVDAAIACHGSYYLPYQVHATKAQFLQAYPNAGQFFALKRKFDPDNKFRNKLWDACYAP